MLGKLLIFKLILGRKKASRNLLALIGGLAEPELIYILLIFNVYFTRPKILLLSLLLKLKFITNQ